MGVSAFLHFLISPPPLAWRRATLGTSGTLSHCIGHRARPPPGHCQVTSRPFPGHCQATVRLPPGHCQVTSRPLPGQLQATSRPLSGYLQAIARPLPGHCQATARQKLDHTLNVKSKHLRQGWKNEITYFANLLCSLLVGCFSDSHTQSLGEAKPSHLDSPD